MARRLRRRYGRASDPKLRKAYDFFREHAGYRVGHNAEDAMALARAERKAKNWGLTVEWEDDPEEWDADVERPAYVMNALVRHPKTGEVIASLGAIGLNSMRDPYVRVVEAELFSEALSTMGAA